MIGTAHISESDIEVDGYRRRSGPDEYWITLRPANGCWRDGPRITGFTTREEADGAREKLIRWLRDVGVEVEP